MVVLTLVDIYWIVVPSWDKDAPHVHLTDIFALTWNWRPVARRIRLAIEEVAAAAVA